MTDARREALREFRLSSGRRSRRVTGSYRATGTHGHRALATATAEDLRATSSQGLVQYPPAYKARKPCSWSRLNGNRCGFSLPSLLKPFGTVQRIIQPRPCDDGLAGLLHRQPVPGHRQLSRPSSLFPSGYISNLFSTPPLALPHRCAHLRPLHSFIPVHYGLASSSALTSGTP